MSAPIYDVDTIQVCVVCMHLHCNGEYNDGEDTAERCAEGIVREGWEDTAWKWTGMVCNTWDPETGECGCEDDEHDYEGSFSWSWCEGCGDTDGGDRYRIAIMKPYGV